MPTNLLDTVQIPRPADLWRAWEATADYVSLHTRQTATLHFGWNSHGVDAPWMAQFNWIHHMERVNGLATAGEALLALWQRLEGTYRLFPDAIAARRAPWAYAPDCWFTSAEQTLLDRLTSLGAAGEKAAVVTLLV